ncbi:MAG TPA: hypothetical protein VMS93_10945 [Candidatus Saccharimonadales bacterium]|nr:hypothetical protein [Candidatus Saccharimonadales bacterium]
MALAAWAWGVALAPGAGAAPASPPPAAAQPVPPPTLAVEDTLPVPRITLREVEVRARRLSLDDILDLIVAGEARRDSLIQDQVYDCYARVIARHPGRTDSTITLVEQQSRVYQARPDRMREVLVRRTGKQNIQISADRSMREEIIGFAFDPRLRKLYRFRILGRDIVGGHVIYRLDFEPRSDLYRLPSGRLWVDTNEFVIVREEFWYRGVSPAPLVFRSLDDCVVERGRVDGGHWAITRILARASFTFSIAGIPPQGDLVLVFDNYRVNRGIDPAVFAATEGEKR